MSAILIEQPHSISGETWFFQTFLSHSGATGGQHIQKSEVERRLEEKAGPGQLIQVDGVWYWDTIASPTIIIPTPMQTPATPTTSNRPADLWLMPSTPVVSTLHIPPGDILRLDADAANADGPNGVMGKLDYGWLLHIGDELEEDQWPLYSEPFMELLRLIKAWGFSYLRLDSDGDTLPQLPTF